MSEVISVSITTEQKKALKKYGISPSKITQQAINSELIKWDADLRAHKEAEIKAQQNALLEVKLDAVRAPFNDRIKLITSQIQEKKTRAGKLKRFIGIQTERGKTDLALDGVKYTLAEVAGQVEDLEREIEKLTEEAKQVQLETDEAVKLKRAEYVRLDGVKD